MTVWMGKALWLGRALVGLLFVQQALVGCSTPGRDFGAAGAGNANAGNSQGEGGAGDAGGGTETLGGAHDGGSAATGGMSGSSGISCVPNESTCDGDRVVSCNAEGTGYVGGAVKCSSQQTCVAGACANHECMPNARFCVGNTVRECADDGLSSVEAEDCGSESYCDAASATCKSGVCAPDKPACDGTRATTCNATGSGFLGGGTVCSGKETCDAGTCKPWVCEAPGETFCAGQDLKLCSADGLSSTLVETCVNKACVAGESACQGDCKPGSKKCSGNGVQTCSAAGAYPAPVACGAATPSCSGAGVCGVPPSCSGLAATCGPSGNTGCCSSSVVTGGSFNRFQSASYPATISDFRLDNYEITVGRFRKFVAAYSQAMTPSGAGKNPKNASDPGWDTAWNASLPTNAAALTAALKCNATYQTWTDAVGNAVAESRPLTCLNWFEAQAFCIWDGGRLPTEAEWNYATAGGSQQRAYPWGDATPDCTYANFYHTDYCVAPGTGATNRVGSESPKGDGRYGQADLGGNVFEWTQDWVASPPMNPCNNCAQLTGTYRMLRGGAFAANLGMHSGYHDEYSVPSTRTYYYGARCGRAP
jgi:formylglycine-generating enzyme